MSTSETRASQQIPPAPVVREQLANAMREVDLLRRILRVAERVERYGSPAGAQQGGRHAT